MKELNPQQEQQIEDFAFELAMIDGPDDMFPPEAVGVREPRQPILPNLEGSEHVGYAAVYDLSVARKNRRESLRRHGSVILTINQLVSE